MSRVANDAPQTPKPVIIKEKLTRQILRSVMAQFRSMPEALLELVDNAFDDFDGVHGGKHLSVDIIVTKNSITVENIGGKGMGVNELRSWLSWGESRKKGAIGEYGQGGKAAMGYLGRSWVVQAKRWDDDWIWEIREDSWDDAGAREKQFEAQPKEQDQYRGSGYCRFEIRNLKKHRQDINRIRTDLSNIYRKHLEEGKATIRVNYKPVGPLRLPLYDGFDVKAFSRRTPQGHSLKGWIGRLRRDARVRGAPKVSGGMRLLRRGRLICDGEYFDHPNFRHRASLGNLIGEVELNKVPVLPNKTGFDTDSPEWEAASKVLFDILKPHVDELLRQREEDTVTREERRRVSDVRDMMVRAFTLLSKYADASSRLGEDAGRKPPEASTEAGPVTEPSRPEEDRLVRARREPRTPPPQEAVGRLQRLTSMPDWELRVLQGHIRSEWSEREGRACLVINKKYRLYEERDGDELYIAETAALMLVARESEGQQDLSEYLHGVNRVMQAFCEVYGSRA